jgi:hypothetical protein
MSTRVVDSTGGSKRGGRERAGVFALGGLIVTAVVVYLALNATGVNDKSRSLLPYQALAATLPESDQTQFRALRDSLLQAESARARTKRWPEIGALTLPSKPAWLLEIQEPEPGTAPDPAPNDEQHHRLPDGTTLHIYVWTHRLGGQIASEFVAQPQNTGWVEVFSQVPNPIYAIRR